MTVRSQWRAEVLDVADRVMEHRQFKAVRDALRTRLQFRDVMYADEIAKVATAAVGLLVDVLVDPVRGGAA